MRDAGIMGYGHLVGGALATITLSTTAAAGDQVARDDVVVPEGLSQSTEREPQKPSSKTRKRPDLPLGQKELERAAHRAHPQLRRARQLLKLWRADRRRTPAPGLGNASAPADLKTRAAAEATREYAQYYRLAAALERSARERPATVLNSLVPSTATKGRPPADPCGRVRWLAREIGLPAGPAGATRGPKNRDRKSSLARDLGLEGADIPSCPEQSEELARVAAALQRVFGSIQSWPAFEHHWIQPLRSHPRANAKRQTQAGAAPPIPRPEELDLRGLTSGEQEDGVVQPVVPRPQTAPPIKSSGSKARLRYSGH